MIKNSNLKIQIKIRSTQDSNLEPPDPKSGALSITPVDQWNNLFKLISQYKQTINLLSLLKFCSEKFKIV